MPFQLGRSVSEPSGESCLGTGSREALGGLSCTLTDICELIGNIIGGAKAGIEVVIEMVAILRSI